MFSENSLECAATSTSYYGQTKTRSRILGLYPTDTKTNGDNQSLITLPLVSKQMRHHQPISKKRNLSKESLVSPFVKMSPSWFLVSIFTREIRLLGSATCVRNQWYLIA